MNLKHYQKESVVGGGLRMYSSAKWLLIIGCVLVFCAFVVACEIGLRSW